MAATEVEVVDARVGAAAGRDDFDVFKFLAGYTQGVGRRRTDNNRGAVLIVVEHRDVHAFAADFLNDKAIRRLDVF